MNLDAWLRQDHSLAEQLKVIEGLCGALNDAHKRGTVHRSLEPSKIEVQSDGTCILTEAMGGTASPRYRAPEIAEGAGHSPQVDQPEETLAAIGEFVTRVLAVHEGLAPAA